MRFISQLWTLFWVIFGSSASAETADIDDWFEMSDACEAIVFDQDISVFDDLAPADPLVNVGGLHEVAVFHPDSSPVASAASSEGSWFLCIVAANPPLETWRAGSLIQAWSDRQNQLALSVENQLVAFDDNTTFEPARVHCGENGRLIVVMAFEYENGEFRIGISNRLPSSVVNPCLN
ncbi:hypothetical protein [uncultured Ruegeria sp.]|uniref:hypothetical protein n=1 Tax=uncultured Ruegeria sp. TaxID=259304 RepID=UPI0026390437|nr:hypothetical protein [uncultured Ruegeria sp.]